MDCILRVINGPDKGQSCRLSAGANLIGRSPKATLRLSAPEVSWEHALITRNGEDYVLENLSALGTFADDAKVTGPVKLRPRDQLRLSKDVVLRFESESGVAGGLLGRRWVLVAAVLVLLTGGAFVVWNPFADAQRGVDNWDQAYAVIDAWVNRETTAHRLPAEVPRLFHEAWRQEQAQDFERSQVLWLRLRLLLESLEEKRGLTHLAADNPDALQKLLASPEAQGGQISDDQTAAALVQFVSRRLAWSLHQMKTSRFM